MTGSTLECLAPRTRTHRVKLILACVALTYGLIQVTACDSNDETTAAAGGTGSVSGVCTGIGASRTLSETCCLDYGLDACGAGLVCAALDGRTIPTCYAEGLRVGGQQCTANSLCASRSCSPTTLTCVSLLGEKCDINTGCTSITTERVACTPAVNNGVLDRTNYTCQLVVTGEDCGPCLLASDCTSSTQACTQGICTNAAGICP